MKGKKNLIVISVILGILLFSSIAQASTFNLGRDTFKVRATNFHLGAGNDYVVFNLGYGLNEAQGYGLEVISGADKGIVGLEYQIPPPLPGERRSKFDFAVKLGAVSGNLWEPEEVGGKVGAVIERSVGDREIYFDGDLVAGSTPFVDIEVGFGGKLGTGVFGVIGYKVVSSQDQGSKSGTIYGLKVNF
jgi:hypothetical protein